MLVQGQPSLDPSSSYWQGSQLFWQIQSAKETQSIYQVYYMYWQILSSHGTYTIMALLQSLKQKLKGPFSRANCYKGSEMMLPHQKPDGGPLLEIQSVPLDLAKICVLRLNGAILFEKSFVGLFNVRLQGLEEEPVHSC